MILFAEETASSDFLGDALKIVQILFYLGTGSVGVVIAILTYRAAIRGWLTPVNAEYQKRVMDRLAKLSEELYAEVDPTSKTFWYDNFGIDDLMGSVYRSYSEGHLSINKEGRPSGGIPSSAMVAAYQNQIRMIRSDPFVPKEIRDAILVLLQARCKAFEKAYNEVAEQYIIKIVKQKIEPEETLARHSSLQSYLADILDSSDMYIEEFSERIAEIRQMMQDHFRKFDPHQPGGLRRAWYWICDHI